MFLKSTVPGGVQSQREGLWSFRSTCTLIKGFNRTQQGLEVCHQDPQTRQQCGENMHHLGCVYSIPTLSTAEFSSIPALKTQIECIWLNARRKRKPKAKPKTCLSCVALDLCNSIGSNLHMRSSPGDTINSPHSGTAGQTTVPLSQGTFEFVWNQANAIQRHRT